MINKAILMGRLAKDPVLKTFPDGNCQCTLRVITNAYWKDRKTGELKTQATGHNVVLKSTQAAKLAAQTLKKGSVVYAEGEIQNRRWTNDKGETQHMFEIVITNRQGAFRRPALGTQSATQDTNPMTETDATDHLEIDFFSGDDDDMMSDLF